MSLLVQNLDSHPISPFLLPAIVLRETHGPGLRPLFPLPRVSPPHSSLLSLAKLSFKTQPLEAASTLRVVRVHFSGLEALSPQAWLSCRTGQFLQTFFSPPSWEAVWSPLQNQLLAKTLKTSVVKRTECSLGAFLRI